MLKLQHCRSRHARLLRICQERRLDAVVVGLPQHVYYFSGHLPFWLHTPAWLIFADGRSCLVSADRAVEKVVADECRPYPAQASATQRQEQPLEAAKVVDELLREHRAQRIGVDASLPTSQLALLRPGGCEAIDEPLWQLRRQKDPDELELMRQAIACTVAMYDEARRILSPGISEIEVFAALHRAAVVAAGEPLSALLGNDFAAGVPGGPAKLSRQARAGQIYILDLGPCYRGYFADNCRAFAVDGKPTDEQLQACDILLGVFPIVEKMARVGVRCRDIHAAVSDYYRSRCGRELPHHLGHGVGLQPHEFPHLNTHWDDVLLENEVFTVEPGIYAPSLEGGIRIENNYRVRADGVESLLQYPMHLA
jgi:Xaa-Pro aminopeptidase